MVENNPSQQEIPIMSKHNEDSVESENKSRLSDSERIRNANIGAFIVLQAVDVVTTKIGFNQGIEELNPLVKHFIELHGQPDALVLKTVSVGITIGMVVSIPYFCLGVRKLINRNDPNYKTTSLTNSALFVANGIASLVMVNNFAAITGIIPH